MSDQTLSLFLGAHLSAIGGLHCAILQAHRLGCSCVQLFTHSNRQWKINPLTEEQINLFKTARTNTGMHVIAHASYLINLASPHHVTRHASRAALIHELERCQQLDIPFLVLHPGARLDSSSSDAIARIADGIDAAYHALPHCTTQLLLENMAGQGSSIGRTFEELALLREQSAMQNRLGFCLDTCHLFTGGYDIRQETGYHAMWHACETTIGKKNVHVLHINDSQKPYDSRLDRHADIGTGQLGTELFRLIVHDHTLLHIPKILETPYVTEEDNLRNLNAIRTFWHEHLKNS